MNLWQLNHEAIPTNAKKQMAIIATLFFSPSSEFAFFVTPKSKQAFTGTMKSIENGLILVMHYNIEINL